MTSLVDFALDAVARGLRVFPLKSRSKEPYAGTHGIEDSTTDEKQIRRWWRKYPTANIGVGGPGITIVDIDTGCEDLIQVQNFMQCRGLTPTLTVRTGRRTSYGAQLYYRGSTKSGRYDINATTGEIRSDTMYGIWAGSTHEKTGEKYEIVVDLPVADWPADAHFGRHTPSSKQFPSSMPRGSSAEDYSPTTILQAREKFEWFLALAANAVVGQRHDTAHLVTWWAARCFEAHVFDRLETVKSAWEDGKIDPYPLVTKTQIKQRIFAAVSPHYAPGERDVPGMLRQSWQSGVAFGVVKLTLTHDDILKFRELDRNDEPYFWGGDEKFARAYFFANWSADFASPKLALEYVVACMRSVGLSAEAAERFLAFSHIRDEVAFQIEIDALMGEGAICQ
jgi:hypothetical protein